MFGSDYPRRVVKCLWLRWFPALDALAVASALPVPFLLAQRRFPVSFLSFPARPFPCRFPASLAAVALARLPGMKALLATFQQTAPHSGPAVNGCCCSTCTRVSFPIDHTYTYNVY